MQRKIKEICITLTLVLVIIVVLIEVGKLLNKSNTETRTTEIKDIVASAGGGGKTYGDYDTGADPTSMKSFSDGEAYCIGHILALIRHRDYEKSQEIVSDMNGNLTKVKIDYEYESQSGLVQSIAYAVAKEYSESDVQDIIWGSHQFKSDDPDNFCLAEPYDDTITYTVGSGNIGRAYAFAEYAYHALINDELKLINQSASEDELRIMVDQSADTYTVGPYKIDITTQGGCMDITNGMSIKDLVYDEITNHKEFCNGVLNVKVEYQNGSSKTVNAELVDENGNSVGKGFPKFGQTFYVRVKSSKTEDIIERISPSIQVKYWKKFHDGSIDKYKSTKVTYRMQQDNASFLNDVFSIGVGVIDMYEILDDPQWLIKMKEHARFGMEGQDTDNYANIVEGVKDDLKEKIAEYIVNQSGDAGTKNATITTLDTVYRCIL